MKKGWQELKLGDILERTETINPQASPNSLFTYIDVSSVSNSTFSIGEPQIIKGRDAPSRARKVVRSNDIIFATIRPTLQRIAIVPEHLDKQVCSTGYIVLRPKDIADYRFIFYFLFSEAFSKQIAQLQKGASYPAVTDEDVKNQIVPLPPLPEQKRIVKILDEAFLGIATAKTNAEKNLENARALFESYLRSYLLDNSKQWKKKPLEELCYQDRVITYGVIKLGEHTEGGIPCLRTSNVRWLRIETEDMKVITKELSNEYSRTILKGGEILVNVRGTLGGVAVVPQEMIGWNVSREVAVVPINHTLVNPAFIAYSIASSHSQDWLSKKKKGAAYVGINIEDLRCLPIRFPPITEQVDVVAQLKAVEAQAQALANAHARKADELDALKKSILNEAFSGNL